MAALFYINTEEKIYRENIIRRSLKNDWTQMFRTYTIIELKKLWVDQSRFELMHIIDLLCFKIFMLTLTYIFYNQTDRLYLSFFVIFVFKLVDIKGKEHMTLCIKFILVNFIKLLSF